jgi:hypothetical protein
VPTLLEVLVILPPLSPIIVIRLLQLLMLMLSQLLVPLLLRHRRRLVCLRGVGVEVERVRVRVEQLLRWMKLSKCVFYVFITSVYAHAFNSIDFPVTSH